MRKAIIIVSFVMLLSACERGDGDAVRLHQYDETEEIYRPAGLGRDIVGNVVQGAVNALPFEFRTCK